MNKMVQRTPKNILCTININPRELSFEWTLLLQNAVSKN